MAFPTETVYGLGADALNEEAARKIYAAKGRPSDNPLIAHISGERELAPLVAEIPETAKKLISRNSRVQIVFGSTSTEFAAEAFDIEALHYMVKPVGKEKLFHILDRFFDSVYSLRTVNVKVGRLEESIYISDILYVEADGKRAKIHTKKGVIDVSMSMADLEEVLPANEFCRPIRWALVSMREIVAMPTDILKLSDKTEIPISRLKRKEIQDAFANYSWRSTRRRMRGGIL